MQTVEIFDDLNETNPGKIGYYCPVCGTKNLSLEGVTECKHLEAIAFSADVSDPLFDRNKIWTDSHLALSVSLGLDIREGEKPDNEHGAILLQDFMEKELENDHVLFHYYPPPEYADPNDAYVLYNFMTNDQKMIQGIEKKVRQNINDCSA